MIVRASRIVLVGAMLSIGLSCKDDRWTAAKIDESRQRGDVVIDALRRFKTDHGRYPAALDELSPKYLKSVEPPTAGMQRWEYISDGNECFLSFARGPRGRDDEWHYTTQNHQWLLMDKRF